jgi:hypothetical protein
VSILELLVQFVFRMTFGVALAMGVTPPRWVSPGFYRIHLWVLMGLNTLAGLTVYTQRESLSRNLAHVPLVLGLAIALAVGSYIGSVCWLYERSRAGLVVIWAIAIQGLLAAALATPRYETTAVGRGLAWLDLVSGGLLLGAALSAMLLGHWYLNAPTMELYPLRRLVLMVMAAALLRGVASGTGLVLQAQTMAASDGVFWILVSMRWLSGLIGTLLLAVMAWYTLKIPNTQSATGILYAGVILTLSAS